MFVGLVVALVLQPGCVHRRMTIRSNPPGAVVYVDNQEIGTTPVSTDFLYYGTREIRLVKDGYETLTVMQPVPMPWYQYPPLDFFSDNFTPGEIRDQRTFTYNLVPQMVVPTDVLLGRGEQLRAQAHASAAMRGMPAAPGTLQATSPGEIPPSPAPALETQPAVPRQPFPGERPPFPSRTPG
jgi:hypothetical protein